MNAAMALEMVHAYSLVHDDLPCMDDDSMRRGRKTAHIMFDEPLALLAGDGLLTDAFGILTQDAVRWDSVEDLRVASQMVAELSQACGSRGMVWGQALDLFWTARDGAVLSDLIDIHSTKTAWLLGASCALGAIAAQAPVDTVDRMRLFGRYVGLAFQIVDDLIDCSEATGKTAGKDAQVGKVTYLKILGADRARQIASDLTASATRLLDILPPADTAADSQKPYGRHPSTNQRQQDQELAKNELLLLLEKLLRREH